MLGDIVKEVRAPWILAGDFTLYFMRKNSKGCADREIFLPTVSKFLFQLGPKGFGVSRVEVHLEQGLFV